MEDEEEEQKETATIAMVAKNSLAATSSWHLGLLRVPPPSPALPGGRHQLGYRVSRGISARAVPARKCAMLAILVPTKATARYVRLASSKALSAHRRAWTAKRGNLHPLSPQKQPVCA